MRRELLCISAADLVGGRPIHRVVDDLSDLADACLDAVAAELTRHLETRFGRPLTENGKAATFVVIGLGKYDGQELNFSSDVYLMFLHSGEGKTDGSRTERRSISNQAFFTWLSEQTEEGSFYRVDMCLRPDGAAGALTMPLVAVSQIDAISAIIVSHVGKMRRQAIASTHRVEH